MKPGKDQLPRCSNCGGGISPDQKSTSVKGSGLSNQDFHDNAHDCANSSPKRFPNKGKDGREDVRDWDYGI